ncbi:MAG: helix-turn-helix domain-containing protein [Prevotellaceae bacterium]|jgi:ribosome-binding protein aMBF1 (putative translation factor)|nr:helix-turn-helix domain-containing protein [Prevotellaceae bacterium]
MQTNNHKIVDYDEVLDAKFGKEGTPSRIEAEEKAYAFYTGQIIEQARKKAGMTQAKLAEKIGSNKSYISRIETGRTEPKVSTFYRIVSSLGLSVELT